MQNVPKIVSERLRIAPPVVNHPDADVLTAFAERSLLDRERATVLEHLAHCGDCRDIVALALPASEALQTVVTPARAGWLTWPALRWGLVAAGVVAVASVGIVQYQHQSRPTVMVAKESHPEPVANYSQAPSKDVNATATAGSDKSRLTDNAVSRNKKAVSADEVRETTNPTLGAAAAASAPTQLAEPVLTGRNVLPRTHSPQFGAPIGGPIASVSPYNSRMQAQPLQQQGSQQQRQGAKQQNVDAAANLKVPAASQTVEVSGAAPQIETAQSGQINTEAANLTAPSPSQPSANMFGNDANGLVRAKPAGTNTIHGAATLALAIPRWTLSSIGGLQRSFDQGSTWQDVNVMANVVPSGRAGLARAMASQVGERKVGQKKALSIPALPAPTPVFRAVAVTGAEVWVGGANGVLYHSLDAGNYWTQVFPSATGATLTGDVVGLEFLDAQHGKVTTSTSEIWITGDDGLTWQKQ